MDYRNRLGVGRAIAAPQIGILKRIIYMHIDHPLVLFNPGLSFPDTDMMEVWDDCMSFPGLLVRVMRHRRCRIEYMDGDWKKSSMELEGDLSELIQHENDQLDGILATMRAIDHKSLRLKSMAIEG
jgi:peptide deformylase